MMKNYQFAVILSGCGVYDGSEIHEATLSLYAISKAGCKYTIFAPNIPQYHVMNHLTGQAMNESRNVLVEAARIARGKIRDLKQFDASTYDALLLPGGFGAAKNLSTFAFDGANCKVDPDVEAAVKSMHKAGKPIGALCIAPVILAKVLGNVQITVGDEEASIIPVTQMGASHTVTTHAEIVTDVKNKLVTSPCYMLDATIAQIGDGAANTVNALIRLIEST